MGSWFRNQRGNVLLFTTVMLMFLLWMGGLATDIGYLATSKAELQRAMDAAAQAGAGKLGFDSSVFNTVRTFAQNFGAANPYRNPYGGTITLDLNTGNDPNGNIVLGVYASGTFTPWNPGADPNGLQVNAVRCRWSTQIPTTFLRLLGIPQLTVAAVTTAIANPPGDPGCGEPTLPIAVTQCSFYDAGTGAFSSQGCGTGLTFIRSNTICDNSPGSPQGCNTATWASLDGSTPNTPYLQNAIQNAGAPGGACANFTQSGENTTANNGMLDPVFRTLRDTFLERRVVPLSEDICPAGGCGEGVAPTYPKEGGGWETAVQMIETACPPGPLAGEYRVLTYARFVITQIFYKQDGCAIEPNPDPQAQSYCYNPDGTARKDPDLRAVFGYFRCGQLGQVATREPTPRAALATRLRIVE